MHHTRYIRDRGEHFIFGRVNGNLAAFATNIKHVGMMGNGVVVPRPLPARLPPFAFGKEVTRMPCIDGCPNLGFVPRC